MSVVTPRRLLASMKSGAVMVMTAILMLAGASFAGATGARTVAATVTATAKVTATATVTAPAVPGQSTSCPAPVEKVQVDYPARRIDGHMLRGDQVATAVQIISIGKALRITPRGIRIAVATALQESSLNPAAVIGDYVGLFQQLYDPSTGLYGDYDRTDVVGATRMFYGQLVKVVPGYERDPRADWAIAETIQQTREGKLFDDWHPTATELVATFYKTSTAYDFAPAPEPVCTEPANPTNVGPSGISSIWDPAMIISDQVFYNSAAMTEAEVRDFIATKDAGCNGDWCLRNLKVGTGNQPADVYCDAYQGSDSEDAASVIAKVSVACHVNPQVMLVTLEKESGLLDRSDVSEGSYDAAWGWHCPDSGPGGSANCDPAYAGFFRQAYGMAKQWSRYVVDPGKYHYRAGQTAEILYNVAETSCGATTVAIKNTATASLYNYTPYQPNQASLGAYPGTGDRCSSYGNRNFFFLFGQYFGTTGTVDVRVDGVDVTIPDDPSVPGALVGAVVRAPNAAVAKGLAAGLAALGTSYVWGGGTNGGPADEGCSRGGGASNSCAGIVGFDCSGLTGYVLTTAGFSIGDNSAAQRSSGQDVSWSDGQPGDLIGYSGHIAVYLGEIDGVQYLLEAPDVGRTVQIRAVYDGHDNVLHRYWH